MCGGRNDSAHNKCSVGQAWSTNLHKLCTTWLLECLRKIMKVSIKRCDLALACASHLCITDTYTYSWLAVYPGRPGAGVPW
jgi:hypothetical protein